MKDLASRWAVGILRAPVLLILGLAFMGGSNQASAKSPPPGKAVVAVAFISTFASNEPITSYQRVALNVISVRLTPKSDPNISTFDTSWVSITVPSGVGRNVVLVEEADLNAIQNIAEIFNVAKVPAKTYNQVELVLDNVTPGNVIPLCATIFPAGEGCVTYPAKFSWTLSTPTPSTTQSIRAPIIGGLNLSKSQPVLTPIVIAIDPGVANPPTAFLQPVAITPTIEVINNIPGSSNPFVNRSLASIQGTINTNATSGFSGMRTGSIIAEQTGTNNIVETVLLPNSCKGKKTCDFIMYLPALEASAGGTSYDLVATGKNTSYAVRSNVNVSAGLNTDIRSTPFKIVTKSSLSFTGKIVDRSTGIGVQAATLNLLVPDGVSSGTCALNPPIGCVVAASAATDEVGNFPLPGNGNNKAPFNLVPLPGTTTDTGYELVTTAAGFNRTLTSVTANSGRFKCVETVKNGTCNVPMDRGVLTGNVTLGGGATGPVRVLVAAEDSGTSHVENMALVTIRSGSNTAPYTMNVPTFDRVAQLDVFASAQDLFNGAPQTATGHSIAVVSGIGGPCALVAGSTPACSTVSADLSPLTCVGHSSVSGTVGNPQGGDTVVLSLSGIEIESVPIIPPGGSAAANYALCAPPGGYTLDHLNSEGVVVGTTPVVLPITTLEPLPTPCPVICKTLTNTNGQCSVCTGTNATIN